MGLCGNYSYVTWSLQYRSHHLDHNVLVNVSMNDRRNIIANVLMNDHKNVFMNDHKNVSVNDHKNVLMNDRKNVLVNATRLINRCRRIINLLGDHVLTERPFLSHLAFHSLSPLESSGSDCRL